MLITKLTKSNDKILGHLWEGMFICIAYVCIREDQGASHEHMKKNQKKNIKTRDIKFPKYHQNPNRKIQLKNNTTNNKYYYSERTLSISLNDIGVSEFL